MDVEGALEDVDCDEEEYHAPETAGKKTPAGAKHRFQVYEAHPLPEMPLPPNLTLTEICQRYPNHLRGEVMHEFRRAGWSPLEMWEACPVDGRKNRTEAEIEAGKGTRPWSRVENQMTKAKKVARAAGEKV